MGNRPRTASIHILDDDSLLHVIHLYRPFLLGEDEDDNARLLGGRGQWVRGRWWYTLTHVCQRWRNFILRSASYLDVSLVCTKGTPVADMLAHSPPLPLVIDYKSRIITAEDEEGIILALKQRDRVRRVRLRISVTSLQKLVVAMDEEYPILEFLLMELRIKDINGILTFPEILQAPHLRHLRLRGFSLPIGPRSLTTAVGLVTLDFHMVHPSTYFHPSALLQWISLLPQLETLGIFFKSSILNPDLERQLDAPIIEPVTLPNLHHFRFHGVDTYLEALIHQIIAPGLKKLRIELFNQPIYTVTRLLRFMNSINGLRLDGARFSFSDKSVEVAVYLDDGKFKRYAFAMITAFCWHLDWQVSCMVQISNSLSVLCVFCVGGSHS